MIPFSMFKSVLVLQLDSLEAVTGFLLKLNGGLVNACTFWMIISAFCISLVMPGSVIPTNMNRAKIKPTVMFVGVVHAKSSVFNPLSSLLLFYDTRNGSNSASESGEDFLPPPDCLL